MNSPIIITTPEQLQAIVKEAVQAAVKAVNAKKTINATDLAAEMGVSVPTLRRMECDGRLPRREGRYWKREAIERWQADRRDPIRPHKNS